MRSSASGMNPWRVAGVDRHAERGSAPRRRRRRPRPGLGVECNAHPEAEQREPPRSRGPASRSLDVERDAVTAGLRDRLEVPLGLATMRWQSSRAPMPASGEIDAATTGPMVISGMKWPSPTSKWKTSRRPRAELMLAESREVRGVDRRLDLDRICPFGPAHATQARGWGFRLAPATVVFGERVAKQAPTNRARRARSGSAHRGVAARSARSPRSPPSAGRACCRRAARPRAAARTGLAARRSSSAKSRSSDTGCETSLPGVFARRKIDTPAWRPIRRTMSSSPGSRAGAGPTAAAARAAGMDDLGRGRGKRLPRHGRESTPAHRRSRSRAGARRRSPCPSRVARPRWAR